MGAIDWSKHMTKLLLPSRNFAGLWRFEPCPNCCPGGGGRIPPPPGSTCCLVVTFSANTCMGTGPYILTQGSSSWSCTVVNYHTGLTGSLLEVYLTEAGGTYYVNVDFLGNTWQKSYVSMPDPCNVAVGSVPQTSGSCTASCTISAVAPSDDCPFCGSGSCDIITCVGSTDIDEIEVDLGGGGWTPTGRCDADICTPLKNQYVLGIHNSTPGMPPNPYTGCWWRFIDPEACWNAWLGRLVDIHIVVSFDEVTASTVRMKCGVTLRTIIATLDFAEWNSSEFSKGENCFPRTLTKSSGDYHLATYSICLNDLPNTITVSAV